MAYQWVSERIFYSKGTQTVRTRRRREAGEWAAPGRPDPAGSSLAAGSLWRNAAPLSESDHWDSAAGPCPAHPEPGGHTHTHTHEASQEDH